MIHSDPTPSHDSDGNTDFFSIIERIDLEPETTDIQAAFEALDQQIRQKQLTSEAEIRIMDQIGSSIPDVAELRSMFESARQLAGIEHPTHEDISTLLGEMGGEMAADENEETNLLFAKMTKTDLLGQVIQMIAHREVCPIESLPRDSIIDMVVQEELFSPEEKNILANLIDTYPASE